MVTTLAIERGTTAQLGSRAIFAAAILVTLSSFAKQTATVLLDLPKPQLIHATFTHTPGVSIKALPVVRTATVSAAPARTVAVRAVPVSAVPVSAVPIRTLAVRPVPVRTSPLADLRTGLASWYGKVLEGHRTASGARFNMWDLTAAHRSLPFGSKVKVTDLRNSRSVVVTITDRGILKADRIIDLSYGAAEKLGMIQAGVDPVRLDLLNPRQALLAGAEPVR